MPTFSLADALRYFFSSFAILFFLAVAEPDVVKRLQEQFSVVGTVAALVTGTSLYFLYRYYVYDWLILWLHDYFRKRNYRTFISDRYKLPRYKLSTTITANRVYAFAAEDHFGHPARPIRAAGVHMLYQVGLWAIPFAVYAAFYKDWREIVFFCAVTVIFLGAAFGLDARFEDEELLLLQDRLDKLDKAAKQFIGQS